MTFCISPRAVFGLSCETSLWDTQGFSYLKLELKWAPFPIVKRLCCKCNLELVSYLKEGPIDVDDAPVHWPSDKSV